MDTSRPRDEVGKRDDAVREDIALLAIPTNDDFAAHIVHCSARRNARGEEPAQYTFECIAHCESATAEREVLRFRFGQCDAVAGGGRSNTCGGAPRLSLFNRARDIAEN